MRYDPTYQQISLNSLVIYRDGQAINKLDTVKISLLQRESRLEEQLYDGYLTINILIDDIRVGDVVECSYTRTGTNPVYKGIFNYNRYLQWSTPIHYQYLRVLWNKPQKLHIKKLYTDVPIKEQEVGDFKEYSLLIKNNKAFNSNSETPKWYQPYSIIYLYESKNWNEVAIWATSLYKNVFNENNETIEIAKQINEKADTSKEKIRQALNYVQSNIRYLGIEMGMNSHLPSTAKETLERRYGDCKDKSVLFISILKALGIEAYPVLVNTKIKNHISKLPPLINTFNHVIVKVISDNKVYWLDPTQEYQTSSLENIYQPDYGYALVVQKETTALESMSNPTQIYKKIIIDHFDLTKGVENNVTLSSQTEYVGYSAEIQRYDAATNSITQLQNRYLNFYSKYYSDIKALMPFEYTQDPKTGDVTQKEKYFIKNFWRVNQEEEKYTGSFYINEITPYFSKPKQLQRNSPYLLEHPIDIEHIIKVQFGKNKWHFLNDKISIDNLYFHLDITTTFDKKTNLLILNYHYKTKTDYVPADKIDEYMIERNKAINILDYGIVKYFDKPKAIPPSNDINTTDIITILVILAYIFALLYIFISWRSDAKKEPKFDEVVYYPMSLAKLFILSIVTLNIYIWYWFYRNYLYQKQRDDSSIMPIARGIFYNFWYYPLYASLEEDSKRRFDENKVLNKAVAFLFAILFLMGSIGTNQDGIISTIAFLIMPLFLMPLANYINYINTTSSKAYIYHSKWRLRHTFLVLMFIPFIMIIPAEEINLIPSGSVVKGEKLMEYDIKYMQRKGMFPANEELLYFYSDASFLIRNNGNGFTKNRVFSYWKEENKLSIKKANFNNIQNIDVIDARDESENTTVTITLKDNSTFLLYISSSKALDKVFVKELKYRWKQSKVD